MRLIDELWLLTLDLHGGDMEAFEDVLRIALAELERTSREDD